MNANASGRRPYLTKELRRNALLVAAAEIVESRGWTALTMVAVAQQAGVSRQLVYQHFESVDQLMIATLTYIFQDVYERTREAILRGTHSDVAQTVAALQRITFDIPAGRARALWQAISAAGTGDGEIVSVSRRLRHLMIKTTQPLIEAYLGMTPQQAGPVIWMLIVAFWGARQLTEDGELSQDNAMQLYSWLMMRVLRGTRAGSPPKMGSSRQAGRKSRTRKGTVRKASAKSARANA